MPAKPLTDELVLLVETHRVVKVDGLHICQPWHSNSWMTTKILLVGERFFTTKSNSVVVDDSLILVALNDT